MSHDPFRVRQVLRRRREAHRRILWEEVERLTREAAALGVRRVILFGSLLRHAGDLTSDVDLLMVWDTPLGFVERTAELYRRLQPRVAVDLLVYTPSELERKMSTPWIRRIIDEGRVLHEV